jgi:hypothetical protein
MMRSITGILVGLMLLFFLGLFPLSSKLSMLKGMMMVAGATLAKFLLLIGGIYFGATVTIFAWHAWVGTQSKAILPATALIVGLICAAIAMLCGQVAINLARRLRGFPPLKIEWIRKRERKPDRE